MGKLHERDHDLKLDLVIKFRDDMFQGIDKTHYESVTLYKLLRRE